MSIRDNKYISKTRKELTNFIRLKGKYKVVDRSKGHSTLCIVLCGYKQILWEEVFYRLKSFADTDIDICLLSSGIYSKELNLIAEENNWSYLYTEKNNVTLIQNIAIAYFKKAKFIFKLDEDIMICENFFHNMINTYNKVQENGKYKIGFVAPLLPINGYCHIRVLEKLGKLDEYEQKFGRTFYGSNSDDSIMVNADAAKYMWNITYELDELAKDFSEREFEYSICPCRYSIGAIYFSRDIWEKMGMFKVDETNGLGKDEVQICSFCMLKSRAIVVSENTLAGHFSFGPQNNIMEEEYKKDMMLNRLSLKRVKNEE